MPLTPDKIQTEKEVAGRWSFPWSVMKVLLGGRSAVDLSRLGIKSRDDAKAFLKSYGFDPELARDQRKMQAVLVESLFFIETYLMPKEWQAGNRPPDEVLLCEDPAHLLLWAGDRDEANHRRRVWACALLKVMHTITHIDDLQRLNNLQEARHQIMGRFEKALFRDEEGALWFGDQKSCIKLTKVEWKLAKTRDSIILKLLHKPGNVAENIYDLVGVRLVTQNLSETMIAVKFLRQFYLVDFPNTLPARARNNLIDVEQFQSQIKTLKLMLRQGQITPQACESMIAELRLPKRRGQNTNPHSSANYRAIQLTCRQRVRYPNPLMAWQKKLKTYLDSHPIADADQLVFSSLFNFVKKGQRSDESCEIAVYFPFEVQILDRDAATSIDAGEASHDRYKRAQVRTARRRILHEILALSLT